MESCTYSCVNAHRGQCSCSAPVCRRLSRCHSSRQRSLNPMHSHAEWTEITWRSDQCAVDLKTSSNRTLRHIRFRVVLQDQAIFRKSLKQRTVGVCRPLSPLLWERGPSEDPIWRAFLPHFDKTGYDRRSTILSRILQHAAIPVHTCKTLISYGNNPIWQWHGPSAER